MILTIVFFLLAREVPKYNNTVVTNYIIVNFCYPLKYLNMFFSALGRYWYDWKLLFSLFGNVTLYRHALENNGILHAFFMICKLIFPLFTTVCRVTFHYH
jgi:hypothetical protein